jgi:cellulase/cellobiase CelA1
VPSNPQRASAALPDVILGESKSAEISARSRLGKGTAAHREGRAGAARAALQLAAMTGRYGYVKRWRTALHLVVAAGVMAIPGLVAAPVAHAAAATATLVVQHSWQDGFIARFAISNSGSVPMNNWKLEFDLPPGESISHAWNSTVTQSGTHWVLSPANWNSTIAPGGSANGGFRGVLNGPYSPPANCMLNRQVWCS